MRVVLRWALGGALAAAFAIGGVAGLGGIAGATPPNPAAQGRAPLLHTSLVPSMPTTTGGMEIFTVPPGTLPWTIASGRVLLSGDGTVQINVARLIDPTLGDNPVPYLAASVYCGGSLVATTATVPFSALGNAHLRATVTLPTTCADPGVLLNPAKTATAPLPVYIAYSSSSR